MPKSDIFGGFFACRYKTPSSDIRNAFLPIFLILSGKSILYNLLQLKKASFPIIFRVGGITIDDKFRLYPKAFSPISTKPSLITNSLIPPV